ncbi:MAG: aminotransferase class I/II-fold pyridoxal phosphate-dependent enzyme, partial [Bacteroidetes bacterium]|nr:aminotransferase class I/II-fold pyridoxal phosphate-dependent enzyme [Bacteroidota bacterium]
KKNLVILQTLSKAWGLAGIRLGMLFAHPELLAYISRVKYPYNISGLTIEAALRGLDAIDQKDNWIKEILEQRSIMATELESLPYVRRVYASDANFLLIKVDDASAVYEFLMNKGIIIRDRSSVPLCEGCLRITVGTGEENRDLLSALKIFQP